MNNQFVDLPEELKTKHGIDTISHYRKIGTNYIHMSAKLGNRVNLQDNVVIYRDVEIGDDCRIGENTFISARVKIGYKTTIKNDCSIEHGAKIDNHCVIQAHTNIGHNVNISIFCKIGAYVEINEKVKIDERVSLYDFVKVKDHLHIFEGVIIRENTNVEHNPLFLPAPNGLHHVYHAGQNFMGIGREVRSLSEWSKEKAIEDFLYKDYHPIYLHYFELVKIRNAQLYPYSSSPFVVPKTRPKRKIIVE